MKISERLQEIEELIGKNEHAAAAALLVKLDIRKMTRQELKSLDVIFKSLPKDIYETPELQGNRMLIARALGIEEEEREILHQLTAARDKLPRGGAARRSLDNHILGASLCTPNVGVSTLLLNLAVFTNEIQSSGVKPSAMTITGRVPSVLRGIKDLSEWGKHYRAISSIVRPMLNWFTAYGGKGVCEVGIAEVLYERGDINGASIEVADATDSEDPEIAFAALALLARIGAVDGVGQKPAEFLRHIDAMLEQKDAVWLRENFDALKVRFNILDGELAAVRTWLDSCDINDLSNVVQSEYYLYMTKAMAYIALGKDREASIVLEKLRLAMGRDQRPLDTIDCLVHSAIVCERLGSPELAADRIGEALVLGQEYWYIRAFSDCGQALLKLLTRCQKEKLLPDKVEDGYVRKIIESAKIYASMHPSLYGGAKESAGETNELTQSELMVLRLLDAGKSNKAIAETLQIELTTARFHISNILQKLGTENRTEAASKARSLGLLK